LIVVVVDHYSTSTYTIVDSKGNTWKTAINYANGARVMVFYAENIIGGMGETVTVFSSAPSYFSVTGIEYTGMATSNSLDVTATRRATAASYTTGVATITAGKELLLGVHHVWATGVAFTPTTGWNTVGLVVGTGDETQVQDQVVSAGGSYGSTGMESTANDTV